MLNKIDEDHVWNYAQFSWARRWLCGWICDLLHGSVNSSQICVRFFIQGLDTNIINICKNRPIKNRHHKFTFCNKCLASNWASFFIRSCSSFNSFSFILFSLFFFTCTNKCPKHSWKKWVIEIFFYLIVILSLYQSVKYNTSDNMLGRLTLSSLTLDEYQNAGCTPIMFLYSEYIDTCNSDLKQKSGFSVQNTPSTCCICQKITYLLKPLAPPGA